MIELFREGGPFMYPLMLWSMLSIAFFLERIWTYARLRSEDRIGRNHHRHQLAYRLGCFP